MLPKKKMNKTTWFLLRIMGTAVDGLDSWSRWQVIDTA